MPRYDLAGNPLPETAGADSAPTPPARYDLAGSPLPPASPTPQAAPVRYDLSGNPLPAVTYAPAPAPATTWPPQPTAAAGYFRPQARNNSGEQADVPPEIARLHWNWGAFFFPIFWSRKHGMTTLASMLVGSLFVIRMARTFFLFFNPAIFLILYCLYALAYFAIQIYFGLQGHQIGWRNRRFDGGFDEFFAVQRAWMYWGFGITALTTVILPLILGLGLLGILTGMKHNPGAGDSYNSGYSSSYSPSSGGYQTVPGYGGGQ